MVAPAERAQLREAAGKADLATLLPMSVDDFGIVWTYDTGAYLSIAANSAIPLLDALEAAEAEIARLKADLAKVGSPVGWGDHLK